MSDISHYIPIIKAEGEIIGLTLNESNCELITSDHEVVLTVRNILPSVTHLIRVTPSFSAQLLEVSSSSILCYIAS